MYAFQRTSPFWSAVKHVKWEQKHNLQYTITYARTQTYFPSRTIVLIWTEVRTAFAYMIYIPSSKGHLLRQDKATLLAIDVSHNCGWMGTSLWFVSEKQVKVYHLSSEDEVTKQQQNKGRDQYAATAIMFRNMNIIHLNLAVWYAFVSGKELSIFQNVLRNQTSSTPVYFISYIVTDAILSRNRERLAVLYIRRHKSTAHNVFTYTIVFYLITQWQFRTMCLCFNCVGFLHSELCQYMYLWISRHEFRAKYVFVWQVATKNRSKLFRGNESNMLSSNHLLGGIVGPTLA